MAAPSTPRVIVAVTGEDGRFDAVPNRAAALAAGDAATVILYDIDAAGMFASPVPTAWSGEGEGELVDEEASDDRLDADALETAGRGSIAGQVRSLRSVGVDAWGWLPTSKGAADLAAYAQRVGAAVVLAPDDLRPGDETAIPFEAVEG